MYAQIISIEWPLGRKVEGMAEVIQTVHDQIVPFAKQQQGFKGFLGFSQNTNIILLTLWETEADLLASQANGYCEHQIDKLSFLLHLSTAPLWCQTYEIFAVAC